MDMCSALEDLKQEGIQQGKLEGIQQGKLEGIQQGIAANIRTCKNFNIAKDAVIENLIKEFDLTEEVANEYMKKYW